MTSPVGVLPAKPRCIGKPILLGRPQFSFSLFCVRVSRVGSEHATEQDQTVQTPVARGGGPGCAKVYSAFANATVYSSRDSIVRLALCRIVASLAFVICLCKRRRCYGEHSVRFRAVLLVHFCTGGRFKHVSLCLVWASKTPQNGHTGAPTDRPKASHRQSTDSPNGPH